MTSTVYVEVMGLTGSGKSAVMGEIEIALKALGLKVEYGPDFQAEKNGTHADWQAALDLYQPTVVLTERNISRQPPAHEDAQPVAWFNPQELRIFLGNANSAGRAINLRKAQDAYATDALYTHPAPAALRVAVEALEAAKPLAMKHAALSVAPKIIKALAAMQAEQGAK